jgi:hypothetical protein
MNIENRGKRLFSGFRDTAVFLGWAAGLFLAGFLLWSLTGTVRDRSLLRTVNRIFIQRGDPRRLDAPLKPPRGRGLPGNWYSLAGAQHTLFVFSVMSGGIMAPYAAFVNSGGKVEEIVPLSAHAEQFMPRFREGLMDIYIRRIESGAGGGA